MIENRSVRKTAVCFILMTLLLSTCLFAPQAVSAAGTTYYFSTSGNDNNDGLSAASPKKTLTEAANLMIAGNTILFKRGDAWYNPTYSWSFYDKIGTASEPITIDAYGTGNLPIIAQMDLFTTGWVDAGGNKWKHTIAGYNGVARCFVNGASKLSVSLSALTDDTKFAVSRGYVYVYSTSAPTFVEVIPSNNLALIDTKNISYFTFKNIDFRGGGNPYDSIQIQAPSSHVTFDSCRVTEFIKSGIVFINYSKTADYSDSPVVQNCYISQVWSRAENGTSTDGDGVYFRNAVENGLVKGNTIVDMRHSSITLDGSVSGYHGVNNCIVEQNEIYQVNSDYGRGFALMGIEGKCQYNIVRQNYIHDMMVTNHALGDHNMIYSNLIVNVDRSPYDISRLGYNQQAYGMDFETWSSIIAHDNKIVNNTIYDTEEYPISCGYSGVGANNVIANNLFVKWPSVYATNYGIMTKTALNPYPLIANNGFWNTSGSEKVLALNWSADGTYTVAEGNSMLSFFQNNIQLAPQFVDETNRNFRLSASSPYISGGMVMTDMGSGFVDFDGNAWNPTSPSIGAFQY